MELGMIGRSEHAEIVAFVGRGVDSELSGNMIDVCPVGALTSKPFRYAARTWELARRRSVSPHDSLGSNLIVQAKGDRVLRVVPFDNPAVNECWISDKDRFSYEGLASDDRLTAPMIKDGGQWKTVDWPQALDFVARGLKTVTDRHGGPALGTVVSPHSTLEEMALAARLTRALGSDNIDFRLRQSDFRGDGQGVGLPGSACRSPISIRSTASFVIGSFLRKDHPLAAQRLRHAARKGAEVTFLHSVADDSRIRLAHSFIAAPSLLPRALAEIVVAAAKGAGKPVPAALADIEPVAAAEVIAASLIGGERKAILLGNYAEQHPEASQLFRAGAGAGRNRGREARLPHGGREQRRGIRRRCDAADRGRIERAVDVRPRRARPTCCSGRSPSSTVRPRRGARCARAGGLRRRDVAVPARHPLRRRAAPHRPLHRDRGHVRQLRRALASLQWRGEASRRNAPRMESAACPRLPPRTAGLRFRVDRRRPCLVAHDCRYRENLRNETRVAIGTPADRSSGIERVADIPIHFADPLVRRAPALQQTADAKPPRARMSALTLAEIGVAEGAQVKVRQGRGEAVLTSVIDAGVPAGVVRIAAAHPSTCGLDGLTGPVTVERA
jgi:NADH-quinone oxidoreductase subunit G